MATCIHWPVPKPPKERKRMSTAQTCARVVRRRPGTFGAQGLCLPQFPALFWPLLWPGPPPSALCGHDPLHGNRFLGGRAGLPLVASLLFLAPTVSFSSAQRGHRQAPPTVSAGQAGFKHHLHALPSSTGAFLHSHQHRCSAPRSHAGGEVGRALDPAEA